MLETLQREIAQKYGLGASAGPLLDAFLSMVDSEVEGHWSGLMQSFRNAGYGVEVATWLGSGTKAAIPPEAVDEVLGVDRLVRLAESTGVNEATVAEVLADVIPQIADALSPNGVIPPSLPGWAAGQLHRIPTRPAETSVKAAPIEPTPSVPKPSAAPAEAVISQQEPARERFEAKPAEPVREPDAPARMRSLAGWVAPAALAGIVGVIAWFATRGAGPSPQPAPRAAAQQNDERRVLSATAERPAQRAGLAPPTLQLSRSNGDWRFSGVVRDQVERERIEEILGELGAVGEVEVDLGVNASNWTPFLRTLLDNLPREMEMTFEGNELRIGGMPSDELARWKEVLQDRVTPDVTITVNDPAAVAEAGNIAAARALEALGESATPAQVVDAMNLQVINFRPGSVRVPSQNADLLETAARLLSDLPGEWRLEIQGHTDSTGSESANQRLSERRAEEVRRLLIREGVPGERLSAIGKGPSEPVASNDTEMGRFKNRRIAFVLAP